MLEALRVNTEGGGPPSTGRRPAAPLGLPARFLRFALVGGSGVIVNLGLLAGLVEWVGWDYRLAALVSIETSTLTNYLLNRAWTWRDRQRGWWSLLSYHGVTAGGMFLQWATLVAVVQVLGIHYILGGLLGIGLATAWNFLANHHFTFRPHRDTPAGPLPWGRISIYGVSLLLQLIVAALLTHPWDTFVFQKTVETFVTTGTTPYATAAAAPDYIFPSGSLPTYASWYAYPPLPLLLMLVGYGPFALAGIDAPWLGRILIKLPFILGNLGFAYVLHRFLSTARPAPGTWLGGLVRNAGRAERFVLLNPLFIVIGGVWGQFEGLMLALLVGSLLAMRRSHWAVAGLFWGAALLLKIMPIYLAPLLLVALARRGGFDAVVRFFGAAGALFTAVSLPFLLWEPSGYIHQVLLMHTGRPPARWAPIAALYYAVRNADPGTLLSGLDVAALAQALSLFSFVLTGLVILGLAAASTRSPVTERHLVYWMGVTLMGGLLTTKVLNEQYVLLPLGLLVAYLFHPGPARRGLPRRYVLTALVAGSWAVSFAALADNVHFLTFLPHDVALWMLGVPAQVAVTQLAWSLGMTVAVLWDVLDVAATVPLLIPLIMAARWLLRELRTGVSPLAALLAPGLPHRVATRGLPVAALALLLVPSMGIALTEPVPTLAEIPEPEPAVLALAAYRTDWNNPVLDPDRPAGPWQHAALRPEAGYFTLSAKKVLTDLDTMRWAGIDGLVLYSSPYYEGGSIIALRVAEHEGFPYALGVDLETLADASGRVPLTAQTAHRAADLLDGPGAFAWTGLHAMHTDDGGTPLFLRGVDRLGGTATPAERTFLDAYATEDAARSDWWRIALGDHPARGRLLLLAQEAGALPALLPDGVRAALPLPPHVLGTGPQLRVAILDAGIGSQHAYDAAWAAALDAEVSHVVVPWNRFDAPWTVEPTRQYGTLPLERTAFWTGLSQPDPAPQTPRHAPNQARTVSPDAPVRLLSLPVGLA